MQNETPTCLPPITRAQWPRLLGALPPERVTACAEALRAGYRVEPLLLAAEGLGLLRMREGCFGEHYHLGEFPLAQAALELIDADGRRFSGGARVLSSRAEYAEAVAILDALLANALPGSERVSELLEDGRRATERVEARRAEVRERTRVEFSLLSSASGEADDVDL
jgi:phosphonate C-P lyase system protein PhnG